jgi:NhaP-type Na+/H+ or K+/H+ antiporter
MEVSPLLFAAAGAAALLAALLPNVLNRVPVSAPVVFLALGMLLFALPLDVFVLFPPDPLEYGGWAEHLTEITVIVSLMGAGLALDRPLGWRRWMTTWRLLAITMPLTIAAVAVLGWWWLGLAPAAAMLLGAALAPTDPVLASDVQVGEPTDVEESEDEVRFSLTSEAGLNDSLAFPFTYAAITMALVGANPLGWFGGWVAFDVVYRVGVGFLVGAGVGWVLGRLFFRTRIPRLRLAERADGFVALGATFLAYGAAEILEGYGFVAVFVCACVIRASERTHGYHRVLHDFIEQIERLLTVVVLVVLGGAISRGLLEPLTMADVALALLMVFVLRPAFAWIGVLGGAGTRGERAAIAFFGIRGVGSLYYIAYGLEQAEFPDADRLWAIAGLVVALSVIVHGITAKPAMARVDRQREVCEERSAESSSAAP